MPVTKINCPTCNKSITWDESYPNRPFCSKRCQLIDLGEWASEGFVISDKKPAPAEQDKPLTPEQIEDIEAMLADMEKGSNTH